MARLLIVAAAGMGSRLGRDEPKALVPLAGRPLISRMLDAIASVPFARAIVAAPPGREGDFEAAVEGRARIVPGGQTRDRKSTRLNSSHVEISYAVFCLKKKKKKNVITNINKKKEDKINH